MVFHELLTSALEPLHGYVTTLINVDKRTAITEIKVKENNEMITVLWADFMRRKVRMAISRGSMSKQITKSLENEKGSGVPRKRKINCARPRGFSERAHCASKKGEVVRGEPLKGL